MISDKRRTTSDGIGSTGAAALGATGVVRVGAGGAAEGGDPLDGDRPSVFAPNGGAPTAPGRPHNILAHQGWGGVEAGPGGALPERQQ